MNKEDTICNSCNLESPRLIHNIRYRNKDQRLCTSCVLLTCKEFYCPFCFGVHGLISKGKLIQCESCNSNSHPKCYPSEPDSKGCSACDDPKRLIFAPKESNGVKVMDVDASLLFLTAAKIGCMFMSGVWEEKKYYAVMEVLKAVMDRKKAEMGVIRAMKDADLKNKDRNVESLLDFSDSDDDDDDDDDDNDNDKSSEGLSNVGRMEKLRIEGEDVRMEIDLNKECSEGE